MRSLIIHNPRSGFGSDAIFEFERALVREGDECTLRLLAADEGAEEAVRDAEDFDCCVLSGGDGTVASLLYALRGRPVSTCVFPSGTANLLFANIGNAMEPAALARACRIGQTATCDLGEMRWSDEAGAPCTRGFALMSGMGFDAQLMQSALPNKKSMGEMAYFAAALANPRPTVSHFRILVDGEHHECDGITCMVANNAMMQGDIQIVPDCTMNDGQLDVIALEVSAAAEVLKPLFAGVLDNSGKRIGRPKIRTWRGREIRVESSEPMPLEVDGEVVASSVSSYAARALPGVSHIVVDSMSPYHEKNAAAPRFSGTDEKAYPDA